MQQQVSLDHLNRVEGREAVFFRPKRVNMFSTKRTLYSKSTTNRTSGV
jgi:hypothetical protein